MTIGNLPTLGGLFVALLYAAAAVLARRAARRQRRDRARPAWWCAIMLALAGLAILRLFDVEEHIARLLAIRAWHGGWYAGRVPVQRVAVGGVLVLGLLGAAAAAVAARRLGAALAAGLGATAALAVLAALRAISLHATDRLLRAGWGPIALSRVIEAGALAVLLAAAIIAGRANGARRRR